MILKYLFISAWKAVRYGKNHWDLLPTPLRSWKRGLTISALYEVWCIRYTTTLIATKGVIPAKAGMTQKGSYKSVLL